MNCERFQENLFEYLDDTLSPNEKAAARMHLQTCGACRQSIEKERLVAQTLSRRLGESVETVALDAVARQKMLNAARKQTENAPESKRIPSFPSWFRLVSAAAACVVLTFVMWHGRGPVSQRASQTKPFSSAASASLEVPVHVSYSTPHYTFHQEGAMVVDALISDTRIEDGALLAKK